MKVSIFVVGFKIVCVVDYIINRKSLLAHSVTITVYAIKQ